MVAQAAGYSCVFVVPGQGERGQAQRAQGVRRRGRRLSDGRARRSTRTRYYNVSDRLVREIPGAWKPDQYSNPQQPAQPLRDRPVRRSGARPTAITHFVCGVGTGGTITGIGRYLKEVSDGRVQIIGADPEGSVYSGGTGRPVPRRGCRRGLLARRRTTATSPTDDRGVATGLLRRRLAGWPARRHCWSVARRGMAAVAAVRLAHELDDPDAVIVVLLPDCGRGYLTKVFDDEWLAQYGFLRQAPTSRRWATCFAGKDGRAARPRPHAPERDDRRGGRDPARVRRLADAGRASAEPPVMAAEVAGSVSERDLLRRLYAGEAHLADPVSEHMAPPLPSIGAGEPVSSAVDKLQTPTPSWSRTTASRSAC